MDASLGWFSEFSLLMKEWAIGAFCAATLDWIGGKVPVRNGIFATLFSIAQLTTTVYAISSLMGLFGGRKQVRVADYWLAYYAIVLMAPTAISRLRNSYLKLHFILYGPGTIPAAPSTCPGGNCNSSSSTVPDVPEGPYTGDVPTSGMYDPQGNPCVPDAHGDYPDNCTYLLGTIGPPASDSKTARSLFRR